MRSIILIILSSTFLIGSTELHQLLKIPFLVIHYNHHKQENKYFTFVDFLSLHYSKNHPDDNDDKEDSKLPFKSETGIAHFDTSAIAAKDNTEKIIIPYYSCKIFSGYPDGILCQQSFSIFHPPRPAFFN
jgi:hypothetical protein